MHVMKRLFLVGIFLALPLQAAELAANYAAKKEDAIVRTSCVCCCICLNEISGMAQKSAEESERKAEALPEAIKKTRRAQCAKRFRRVVIGFCKLMGRVSSRMLHRL